jgi:Ala-tRNA(Pro) deacylase
MHTENAAATVHARLTERRIPHDIVEHPSTFRAVDEARAVGASPGRVAKTVVAVDHDRFWLAVVPASRSLDLERLRLHTGASRHLRLATEDEIGARFGGFDVGATPPLGALIGADEVIDPLVLAHGDVVCAAGDHQHAVRLTAESLLDAAEPIVADIARHVGADHRRRFAETPYR